MEPKTCFLKTGCARSTCLCGKFQINDIFQWVDIVKMSLSTKIHQCLGHINLNQTEFLHLFNQIVRGFFSPRWFVSKVLLIGTTKNVFAAIWKLVIAV